eukprot:321256_1
MSGNKLDQVKKTSNEIAAHLKHEIETRHAEALARSESILNASVAKAANMSRSRIDEVKQTTAQTAAQLKQEQEARHAEAEARAELIKRASIAKAANMSVNKLDEVKQTTAKAAAQLKQEQEARHAEAEARAEEVKRTKAMKGKRRVSKVQECRENHFNHLESFLMEKKNRQLLKETQAAERFNEINSQKVVKASKMSGTKEWVVISSPTSAAMDEDLDN